MMFKINLTKAHLLWKMQEWKRPAQAYLLMEGKVSKQYCFMVIRELFELGLMERRQGLGRAVVYRTTPEGIETAKEVLKKSSSVE